MRVDGSRFTVHGGRCAAGFLGAMLLSACLEPAKPYLAFEDQTPPQLIQSRPNEVAENVPSDLLKANEPATLVFSEELDVRSLRPGISVRREGKDVEIEVFAQGDGGTAFNTYDFTGRDKPYAIGIRRPNGEHWQLGRPAYIIRLNTLLIDTEGNPLEADKTLRFEAAPVSDGGI